MNRAWPHTDSPFSLLAVVQGTQNLERFEEEEATTHLTDFSIDRQTAMFSSSIHRNCRKSAQVIRMEGFLLVFLFSRR